LRIRGKNLKKAIRLLDLTQEEAAKQLGVTRQTVSNWASKTALDEKILQLVKLKLGVNLEEYCDISLTASKKGIELKEAIKSLGITQEEAAKRLNISRPTMSSWCNKEILSHSIINKVKTHLDIDLTDITEKTVSMPVLEKAIDNSAVNEIINKIYSPDVLKDKVIELLESAVKDKDAIIKDKQEIIELQRKLLNKSGVKNLIGNNFIDN